MRIIEGKKDYYDCIMREGVDTGLVYVRRPRKVLNKYKGFRLSNRTYRHFKCEVIGFAGKLYPVVIASNGDGVDRTTAYCYSVEEVDKWVQSTLGDKAYEGYVAASPFARKNSWDWCERRLDVKKFFNEQPTSTPVFEQEKTPIFVARCEWNPNARRYDRVVEIDALLKDYDFMRMKPPQQAYQEIAMFLGGMAFPNKEIPRLDDETMAEIKGHGGKYSFRKPPSKGKKR